MNRLGSMALLAAPFVLLALTSCSSVDCEGGNDTGSILRSVPVSSPLTSSLPAPGQGEVLKQTWTIEGEGNFFVNQKTEKKEGSLGVNVSQLEPDDARRLLAEPFSGVLVQWVEGSGPAARAGIIPDDIITAFAGKSVAVRDGLEFLVQQLGPGRPADVEILRRGIKIQIKVELGNQPQVVISRAFERKLPVLNDTARTGLRLVELTDEVLPLVQGPGAEKGLLVTSILPGGPGYFAELQVRDVVVKVGPTATPAIADYAAALDVIPPGTVVPFTIIRNGKPVEAPVEVEKNAGSSWGFNLLGLVKYRKEPSNQHFSLIWGLLFNCGSCYSIREKDNRTVNYHERGWGAVLDLVRARSTPKKGELRLLWLFPIVVRSD